MKEKEKMREIRLSMKEDTFEKIKVLKNNEMSLGKSIVLICLEQAERKMRNV